MTRIYADAYERAGRDAGLTGAAAQREADEEFADEGPDGWDEMAVSTMPAELLEDPAGISCAVQRRPPLSAALLPPPSPRSWSATCWPGLAALVHPHGSVDSRAP